MTNWPQQFELIKKVISEFLARDGKVWSYNNAGDWLGVGRGRVNAWSNGQRPSSDDLELLADKLGLSPAWLLTGRGTPREEGTREPGGAYDHSKRTAAMFLEPGGGSVEHRSDRPVMGVILCPDAHGWPAALLEYIFVPELFPELSGNVVTLHQVPGRGWPLPRAWFKSQPEGARFGAVWAAIPEGLAFVIVRLGEPEPGKDMVVMSPEGPGICPAERPVKPVIGTVVWSGFERPAGGVDAETLAYLQSDPNSI